MSNTTTPMPTADLKQIVAWSTAGLTPAQIAQRANEAGITVPRDGAPHPSQWPDRGRLSGPVGATVEPTGDGSVTNYVLYETFPESRDGFNLATEPANPSQWTAAAISQVLAAPEADPADNWAAARAKLDSEHTTTLTVA